jgi:hypothetical protein
MQKEFGNVLNILINEASMYVPITRVLRINLRKEFAIVAGLDEDFIFEDGLLILSESFCLDLLSHVFNESQSNSTQQLRMCLDPNGTSWEDPLPSFDSKTLRLNSISLRFFTNCSRRWRFRSLILPHIAGPETFIPELDFLKQLSGFKAFNYHLYNHLFNLFWVPTFPNYSLLYLNALMEQSVHDPSNFSPLHILLVGFTENAFEVDHFSAVVSHLLDRSPTQAMTEFSISLCLLPNLPPSLTSKCTSLIPTDSPFRDLIV